MKNGRHLRVGIIGAGRVGAVLGAALVAAGHRVVAASGVSAASVARAQRLLPQARLLPVDQVPGGVDLVLLAVPDDALAPLARGLAEAGVIGKPDPVAMEVVKAFVSLRPGHEPSDALRRELLGFARQRLGAVVAPKEIAFRDSLPRTRSGKIMRRLLKARELGLPEGDVSTLEGGA